MAKLEEISELLVSEIKDFEEVVKRLEEIQKKKITLDITDLRETFDKQERILLHLLDETGNNIKLMENTIGKAKIYPLWVIILFIISLILNFLTAVVFFTVHY